MHLYIGGLLKYVQNSLARVDIYSYINVKISPLCIRQYILINPIAMLKAELLRPIPPLKIDSNYHFARAFASKAFSHVAIPFSFQMLLRDQPVDFLKDFNQD